MPTIATNTTNLQITPKRIAPEFGTQMKIFLDRLFSPTSIRPKTAFNRMITAREFAQHLELVDTFIRNGSFPSVQDVFEGLMDSTMQRSTDEACSKYRVQMDRTVVMSQDGFSPDSFERVHHAFSDQAKDSVRANPVLRSSPTFLERAITKVASCTEVAKKDYQVKFILQREATEQRKKSETFQEEIRFRKMELERAQETINQQSTMMAVDSSWTESIMKPVKFVIFAVLGFAALAVLYAAVQFLGKRCFSM
ncbi:hypothetical protein RvY_01900 [Ramazzottius varieornatus]|uniref:Uncharacterized protein n=1 Tax=Ramazzottius varieornatus TaxID=947166 RepID=A0A1D1UNX0_RAMVA|nr:hypothetical protein RvY_01900 [Ramazzottius varieornatus]